MFHYRSTDCDNRQGRGGGTPLAPDINTTDVGAPFFVSPVARMQPMRKTGVADARQRHWRNAARTLPEYNTKEGVAIAAAPSFV